jgi:hypothetical protein
VARPQQGRRFEIQLKLQRIVASSCLQLFFYPNEMASRSPYFPLYFPSFLYTRLTLLLRTFSTRQNSATMTGPREGLPRQSMSVGPQDAQFDRELEEIRRYEDFTTIGMALIVFKFGYFHFVLHGGFFVRRVTKRFCHWFRPD